MSAFHSGASAPSILLNRRAVLSHSAAALAVVTMSWASPAALAQDASSPTAPVQQLNAALLAAMKAGQNAPFAQRYAMLTPAVEQAFDLNALLRAAVGLSWDTLPTDQKAALAGTFERYTVSNYAANFDSYNGQSFRVLPQTLQPSQRRGGGADSDCAAKRFPGGDRLRDAADAGGLEGCRCTVRRFDQPGRGTALGLPRVAGERRRSGIAGRVAAESRDAVQRGAGVAHRFSLGA